MEIIMDAITNSNIVSLPPLPYRMNQLEPIISEKTLNFHYGKHHKGYVKKLNGLIDGTEYCGMSLTKIIRESRIAGDAQIFNNAAQVWNHNFYWLSLSPNGGKPSGDLAAAIERDLGGFEKFKEEFGATGAAQFGSGWVWLLLQDGKLKIEKMPNAETPSAKGKRGILTIDVWEHAYYLDYKNRRKDYLATVIDNLLDWNFAAKNFSKS
jgi:Fe-Mn family superoxide dismutase